MPLLPKFEKMLIIVLLLVSAFLRFFNLMHDAPYFFNPDERNMASAITRFSLPRDLSQIPGCLKQEFFPSNNIISFKYKIGECSLNPQFFAYGQFPLYLSYASDQITKPLTARIFEEPSETVLQTSFQDAVYWLRFYSALSSVATVFVVYLIARSLLTGIWPLLTALATAFLPGLIQGAHFGTTESLLTFFFMTVVFLSLKLLHKFSLLTLFLIAVVSGLSLGSKLTGIFFLFAPAFVLLLSLTTRLHTKKNKSLHLFLKLFLSGLFILAVSLLFFVLSSPYNLIEPEYFKSAVFGYETDVATGKYEAFYTRQFFGSYPFLFQAEKVFPYVLGWPVFAAGILGLILILGKIVKKTRKSEIHLLLVASFMVYLIPNSALFVKWSRFMTPVLPFFVIFAFFLMAQINKILKNNKFYPYFIICYLLFALTPGIALMSVYANEDSRITASRWINENIPDGSYILSETANVVDIPLILPQSPLKQLTVISFDFYHLNERPELYTQLLNHLENADYILIPSRRIFKNHALQPGKFEIATKYYSLLFSGKLGFKEITRISSYPEINLGLTRINIPDEDAEETITVFDHPVIRIYKKITPMTGNNYSSLFENI